jgi:hypothetical protein
VMTEERPWSAAARLTSAVVRAGSWCRPREQDQGDVDERDRARADRDALSDGW